MQDKQLDAAGKNPLIEYLRGAAALIVAWYHFTLLYPEGPVQLSGILGFLGVPVFFVISGFVLPFSIWTRHGITYSRKDFISFAERRLVRIEPPYLVSVLLAFSLWHVAAMTPGFRGVEAPTSIAQLLLHIAYLPTLFGFKWLNDAYWTLAFEFCFYMAIGFLYPQLMRKPLLTLVGGTIIGMAYAFLVRGRWSPHVPLFAMGVAVFLGQRDLLTKRQVLASICGATLVSGILSVHVAAAGLLASLLLLYVYDYSASGFVHRLMLFLGTISYSLYITHSPVGGRVVNLGVRFVSSELGRFALSLTGVAVSIAFATLFWYFIERRFVELAKRIGQRNRKSTVTPPDTRVT